MILTKVDLISPEDTLHDELLSITLTRADIIFLNECIGVINIAIRDGTAKEQIRTITRLINLDKQRPGLLSLPFISPSLFNEHWVEFLHNKLNKILTYYQTNPDDKQLRHVLDDIGMEMSEQIPEQTDEQSDVDAEISQHDESVKL